MHEDFNAAGVQLVGISVDSPQQQSAMIEKLRLPFPLLSDPDRTGAIEPYGVADPDHPRSIAYPTLVVLTPDGEEAFRVESRDFADRVPEDEALEKVRALGLEPVRQQPPQTGEAQPGDTAMSRDALKPYYRGARFAAVALGMRYPEIKDETDRYVAQMDRYFGAIKDLEA